jgi:putative transposase-like DNA-binding protein
MFRGAGVLARQHRLRRQGEQLQARLGRYQNLIDGRTRRGLPSSDALEARAGSVRDEIRTVSRRRLNLNDALAWAAARWAADQTIAAGASVIYVEDLRSMEARGMGRAMNTRVSQQVRGKITDRLRHIAAEAGIAVVTAPARGTSKNCPQCLTPLRHCTAPDRPGVRGWKWAVCPACGYQGDRDMGAWKRIAARGLAHQAHTTTIDRKNGAMAVRTITGELEAAAVITAPKTSRTDRSKTGPTRRRSARPAPRRHRAPSPARPPGLAGQRPEGHAHTDRARLPRAASRYQGAHAIITPRPGHRARGAALGAGFHLHAHASPPRWEPAPAPGATSGTGPLR